MQFFIAVGIVIFATLFFLMSLPIYDDGSRVEPDTKTKHQLLD